MGEERITTPLDILIFDKSDQPLTKNEEKILIVKRWIEGKDLDTSKKIKEGGPFIINSSIYVYCRTLKVLLQSFRNRLKSDDPARLSLEDAISLFRHDISECFRDAFNYDNTTEEELNLKRKGVRKLKNLCLEAEDCVKTAIESSHSQIKLNEIQDVIINFGKLQMDIDKWALSLKQKKS